MYGENSRDSLDRGYLKTRGVIRRQGQGKAGDIGVVFPESKILCGPFSTLSAWKTVLSRCVDGFDGYCRRLRKYNANQRNYHNYNAPYWHASRKKVSAGQLGTLQANVRCMYGLHVLCHMIDSTAKNFSLDHSTMVCLVIMTRLPRKVIYIFSMSVGAPSIIERNIPSRLNRSPWIFPFKNGFVYRRQTPAASWCWDFAHQPSKVIKQKFHPFVNPHRPWPIKWLGKMSTLAHPGQIFAWWLSVKRHRDETACIGRRGWPRIINAVPWTKRGGYPSLWKAGKDGILMILLHQAFSFFSNLMMIFAASLCWKYFRSGHKDLWTGIKVPHDHFLLNLDFVKGINPFLQKKSKLFSTAGKKVPALWFLESFWLTIVLILILMLIYSDF